MSNSRYLWIAVIVLLIGAGVYIGVRGRQNNAKPPAESSVVSAQAALDKLYAEAQRDLKNKKLLAAGVKFRQLANMDQNFKDADAKAKAIAAELLKQANKALANGDSKAAVDLLKAALAADPTNQKIKDKLKELPGGSTDPGNNTPPPAGTARPIPADATPLSLVIGHMSGYQTFQSGWLKKPIEAGSIFLPTAGAVRSQIDRVLTTIAKFDSKQTADAKLKEIKDAWPLDNETVTINGHSAYMGIYNFENDPVFKLREMATIAWTRDNWFFQVEVLPQGTPDSRYKKGIAKDVAGQLGY